MSATLEQIYIANPITVNLALDLMYFSRSPYSTGNDAAMTFANFAKQFQSNGFNYAVDTGTSTAYVAAFNPPFTSYFDGMRLTIKPANTNSVNNPTVAVDGMAAKAIYLDGYNLNRPGQGDIQQDVEMELEYSSANNGFMLLNPQLSMAVTFNVQSGLYDVVNADTGTTNAVVGDAVFYPGSNIWSRGTRVYQKISNTNTGDTTYQFAGMSALQVVLADGNPLAGNELQANSFALFVLNPAGTKWQLINPFQAGGGGGGITDNGLYSVNSGYDGNGAWGFLMSNTTSGAKSTSNNVWVNGGTSAFFLNAGGFTYHSGFQNVFAAGYLHEILGTCVNSFAFGRECIIGGQYTFAVGYLASATKDFGIAMGRSATVSNTGSFVMTDGVGGTPPTDSAANQFVRSFQGGFYDYIGSTLCTAIDDAGNFITNRGVADTSTSFQAPMTGDSITLGDNSKTLVIQPAGTLVSLTIVMPANPVNCQEVRFSSSQVITTLTVNANAGQTISNAPTTIAAGQGYAFMYKLADTNWVRLY